jgi:hypothetical protein
MIRIGDKSEFSIDITYKSLINGFILANYQIWIEGQRLGYFNDESVIGTLLDEFRYLKGLSSKKYHDIKIPKNLKAYFYVGQIFQPGESLDDFEIRALKSTNSIHFIWRLKKQPFFSYAEYNFLELHYGKVSLLTFESVVKEFEQSFFDRLKNLQIPE